MIYMGVSREQLINAWKQHGRADPEVFNDKMLEMFCFRTRCTRQVRSFERITWHLGAMRGSICPCTTLFWPSAT